MYQLTQKDLLDLKTAQEKLIEARKTVEALSSCGQDCALFNEEIDNHYNTIDSYRREFGKKGGA